MSRYKRRLFLTPVHSSSHVSFHRHKTGFWTETRYKPLPILKLSAATRIQALLDEGHNSRQYSQEGCDTVIAFKSVISRLQGTEYTHAYEYLVLVVVHVTPWRQCFAAEHVRSVEDHPSQDQHLLDQKHSLSRRSLQSIKAKMIFIVV
jgi:hypothetical protein